ncbi:MAG: hypothetical protein JJU32_13210 [Phormidium sp. BM_Day4_Bin.17]|nr:hypothetical protein [Phormidium sp. BM_Day4_Bin.17]UCJ13060.1 MAG: hypothetical protein JWS08_04540 [Phormidium sp. PBR-2020]
MLKPVNPEQFVRMREQMLKARGYRDRQSYKNRNPIDFKDVAYLTMASNWNELGFMVPREKCIWGHGWRCCPGESPFVNFYRLEESLDEFYNHHCPDNFLEAITLSYGNKKSNFVPNPEPLKAPWSYTINSMSYIDGQSKKGEKGLGIEHGHQHNGPVTLEKLSLEKKRLRNVFNSIQNRGYNISRYGDTPIRVQFLVKRKEFLCVIGSAQHRSSALSALGWQSLPVIQHPNVPRLITEQHLDLLAGKAYPEESLHVVKTVFDAYFDETLRKKRKQALEHWMKLAEAKVSQCQPTSNKSNSIVEF